MSIAVQLTVEARIDDAASLFEAWRTQRGDASDECLIRLEHATREWMVTLARNAEFNKRPVIQVALQSDSTGYSCSIVDNSEGMPCSSLTRNPANDEGRAAMYMVRLLTDHASYRRGPDVNRAVLHVRRTNTALRDPRIEPVQSGTFADHLLLCLNARQHQAA